ncbi:MAG TPA: glycosyltransferase family 2 protein [Candidatus Acidoferrales bacterium]|nr:glycosyltransferase family 2 protein [Candidatus Acidoferrales bacterium]
MKDKVAILIPTLNEEMSIGQVIDRMPVEDLSNKGYEMSIYVIDGNSVDRTQQIAVEKGAELILEKRPGKGAAMQTAFKRITADYLIMIDGDNTYPPEKIVDFLDLLKNYDIVLGSRLRGNIADGAMPKINVFGNFALTLIARVLYRKKVTDVCTGFWGFRGEAINSMELVAQGFEIEADMFAECARHDFSIAELPIDYSKREDRPKLSSIDDGLRIGLFLFKKRYRNGRGQKR